MPRRQHDFRHDRDKAETKSSDRPHDVRTLADILNDLREQVRRDGFQLIPELGGAFCGHSLYTRASLQIADITPPDGFYFWQKVEFTDPLHRPRFYRSIRNICGAAIAECREDEDLKYEMKLWMEVLNCFIDRPLQHNNAVTMAAASAAVVPEETITLSGKPGNYQVVPQVSWFPENVQALDARKLLSILPDAEAHQLMLILGRLMCGAKNSRTAEGLLEHTARSYAILVGRNAGMGKSSLVNHIKRMVTALGYTTAEINTDFNRFGWKRIARSSLATVDDLTEVTQKNMIQNGYVKTVVSNDKLATEDKGQDAIDVTSKTVIIGCSNDSHYAHFIGMDSGALSRLNLLATYKESDIAREHGLKVTDKKAINNFLLPKYWENLASELGTSADTLCCYLLARSAEMFLSECGYELRDGYLHKAKEATLYETTLHNRTLFRIRPSLQHMEELVKTTANLCALAIHYEPEVDRERLLAALDRTDLSAPLILAFFSLIAGNSRYEAPLDMLKFDHVAPSCIVSIRGRLGEISKATEGKNSEQAFEAVVKELKSTHGFGYPSRSSNYQEYWNDCCRDVDVLLEYWSDNPPPPELKGSLKAAVDRVVTYLRLL